MPCKLATKIARRAPELRQAVMATEQVSLISSQSHSSGSSDSVAPSRTRTVLRKVGAGVKGVLGLPDKNAPEVSITKTCIYKVA